MLDTASTIGVEKAKYTQKRKDFGNYDVDRRIRDPDAGRRSTHVDTL